MVSQTSSSTPTTDLGEYIWRPLRREDGQALNRMLLEIEAVDQRGWVDTLEDRERDFDDPMSNYETDSMIAETPEGEIAVVGWLFTPEEAEEEYLSFYFFEIHPNHRGRGLEDKMMEWMEARARQILGAFPADKPRGMRVGAADHLTYRAELFTRHGFEVIRHSYRMRRDLSQPIPEVVLPAGIHLENWTRERDPDTLRAFNEAFRDHWAFIPASEKIWDLWVTGHPTFRPDLSFLAVAADEDNPIAGFSVNRVNVASNQAEGIEEGWIQDLAVRRPYRKQGLATALLCASMWAFKEAGLDFAGLGVDAQNLTGALRLYQRLGFEVIRSYTSYNKLV